MSKKAVETIKSKMNYFETLNSTQLQNMDVIISRMQSKGFTNSFSIAALLSIVSKESNFIPTNETTYRNTSNDRIRKIFGSRVAKYSESALSELKKNDANFFEAVYGGEFGKKNGNTNLGDGYKYRGRGFNGITFRSQYKILGKKIGVNLEASPDKLNDITTAADALIQYYVDQFKVAGNKLAHYNSSGINDFKTLQDALGAFYHSTTGWGHSTSSIMADVTGGLKKAKERVQGFYNIVKHYPLFY